MAEPTEQGTLRGISPELRPRDQATVAGLVALGLLALFVSVAAPAWRRPRVTDSPWVDLDAAPPRPFRWQVDVNRAPWAEIAVLPGVGDQLARDLVADRQGRGPFHSVAELRRVRGIGPRTLQRIEPWLAPLGAAP